MFPKNLDLLLTIAIGYIAEPSGKSENFKAIPHKDCVRYCLKMIYIIISLFFVAVGVFLYVNADLLPLPSEGVMLAFSKKQKSPFTYAKWGLTVPL